jgi:ubiquinone/menaquinone biosynthesis C-methylase UbiE
MLTEITSKFRKINTQMNDRLFGAMGNSYLPYLALVDQHLPPSGVIIDLGSGSVSLENYRSELAKGKNRLIAVDGHFDGLVKNRTRLRTVADAVSLPFRNETVDIVCASCVFEHIENPVAVVSECHRVLKKGGALVFYTPNRRSYVAAIAKLTPVSFHRRIRMLQTGRSSDEVEVCETYYRMNTLSDLVQYGEKFDVLSLNTYIGAPCYTTFMPPPIHLIFIAIHKVLQRMSWLRRIFGESIIGCWVKAPNMQGTR